MTGEHRKSWRLRLIIIACGLALGFIAKWFAGHYKAQEENPPGDGDKPARQVAQSDMVIPRRVFLSRP